MPAPGRCLLSVAPSFDTEFPAQTPPREFAPSYCAVARPESVDLYARVSSSSKAFQKIKSFKLPQLQMPTGNAAPAPELQLSMGWKRGRRDDDQDEGFEEEAAADHLASQGFEKAYPADEGWPKVLARATTFVLVMDDKLLTFPLPPLSDAKRKYTLDDPSSIRATVIALSHASSTQLSAVCPEAQRGLEILAVEAVAGARFFRVPSSFLRPALKKGALGAATGTVGSTLLAHAATAAAVPYASASSAAVFASAGGVAASLREGSRVEYNHRNEGRWIRGRVLRARGDGTYDVETEADKEAGPTGLTGLAGSGVLGGAAAGGMGLVSALLETGLFDSMGDVSVCAGLHVCVCVRMCVCVRVCMSAAWLVLFQSSAVLPNRF